MVEKTNKTFNKYLTGGKYGSMGDHLPVITGRQPVIPAGFLY
jgi:hypothetical protein